jgi:hypothetical protein
LDICHAGGFAALDKGKSAPVKSTPFDFLEGEAARLKDLGQRDVALLAACGAQESAQVRDEEDLSVMTYYLVESLVTAKASLSLEQSYAYCKGAMEQYFAELNRGRQSTDVPPLPGHTPQLSNSCTQPVLLKL